MRTKRPAASPLRKFWQLEPAVTFLNHGSFGACPTHVLAHQAALRRDMESEPVRFLWRNYDIMLRAARADLAKFLHANPRDLVFTTNATTAVNAIVRSWKLRRNDEVLTTSHDYNACRNALTAAARAAGAKVIIANLPFPLRSPDEITDAILSAITPRTRYAMIDHVTSGSALILPIAKLIRELENRGIDTLVDGAHAPGMLALDMRKLNPAWYTGNLHKWVCAPKGAAFLWARQDQQAALQPAVISHGNNTPRDGFTPFQNRFDWAGTFDPTAWFCVGEAIRYLATLLPGGWPAIRKHNHALAVEARHILCAALGVEPPCPVSMIGSMATIPLPPAFQNVNISARIAPEQLRLFDEFHIEVPFVRIGSLRAFRVSAHIHNCAAEYARLAAAIPQLAPR